MKEWERGETRWDDREMRGELEYGIRSAPD